MGRIEKMARETSVKEPGAAAEAQERTEEKEESLKESTQGADRVIIP